MTNIESFTTTHMLAMRIVDSDFADLLRLNQEPEVAKTMGGTRSEIETREQTTRAIDHWKRYGYGLWLFRAREDARFIGRGGLRNVEIDGAREIEIAYAVMPEFWRRGLATEMAQAFLDVAAQLGIRNLVAFTLPTNLASRGVMEKVGFRYERDIMWANLPHVLYRRKL